MLERSHNQGWRKLILLSIQPSVNKGRVCQKVSRSECDAVGETSEVMSSSGSDAVYIHVRGTNIHHSAGLKSTNPDRAERNLGKQRMWVHSGVKCRPQPGHAPVER
jgi:hypothetical protein